jgi:hypothetical protein
MSIQVNTGASAVNWESLLSKIGDVTKTTNNEGKELITLTMKDGNSMRTLTFGIPDDLDQPEKVDDDAIAALCTKLAANKDVFNISDADIEMVRKGLTSALAEINKAASAPGSSQGKSVMFDIYKMMALLVEVAQKQRDATREMRQAQSLQVQTSIQNQANEQRTAAITGLIAGTICCGMQVITTGVALYKQGKAYVKQTSTAGASGLDSARQDAAMLKTANTADASAKQLAKVQSDVGNNPSGIDGKTVEQAVNDGFQRSHDAAQRLASAKGDLQTTIEERQTYENLRADENHLTSEDVAGLTGETGHAIKSTVAAMEAQKKLVDLGVSQENIDSFITKKQNFASLPMQDKVEVMNMQKQYGDLLGDIGDRTSTQLKADLHNTLETKVNDLRTAEQTGKTAVETARTAYRDAVKADITRFENEFEIARHEVDSITKDTPKADADAAKAKFTAAKDKLRLARAIGYDKLAQPGITTENEYFQDVKNATDKITLVDHARQNTTEYKDAQRTIDRTNTAISITNMLGSAVQSMITNVNQWQMSDVTREGAAQKQDEEQLEQTKDLFQQAQNLVESAIQLMQAVIQAENQSMRDAIQA